MSSRAPGDTNDLWPQAASVCYNPIDKVKKELNNINTSFPLLKSRMRQHKLREISISFSQH